MTKRKAGRPPEKRAKQTPQTPQKKQKKRAPNTRYSYAQFKNALEKYSGSVGLAAQHLKCDRGTVYDAIKKYPEFVKIKVESQIMLVDVAEMHFKRMVYRGEWRAVDRVLFGTAEGQRRGYVERIEHTGAEGGPIEIETRDTTLGHIKGKLDRLAALFGKKEVSGEPNPSGAPSP